MSIFLPPYQNGSDDLLLKGMLLFSEMDDDEWCSKLVYTLDVFTARP